MDLKNENKIHTASNAGENDKNKPAAPAQQPEQKQPEQQQHDGAPKKPEAPQQS